MKFFSLVLGVVILAGCATSDGGKKLGPWETLKKWDESMSDTESRLQSKRYND